MASFARQSLVLRQSFLPVFRSPLLARNAIGVSQAVAFHASAKRQILPPLPQTIQGTVNDPAPVPKPRPTEGSYHWTFERVVAAGLVPLTVAPFAGASLNPVMDATLCALLVIHSHIGFGASITDYFRPQRVPQFRKLLDWILRIFTVTTAVGLYEFETNDVGLVEGIKRVWKA